MARELTRRRGQRDTSYATPDAEPETAAPARGQRRGGTPPTEDDKPKRGTGTITKGWGSYKKTADATRGGDFAPEFKPRDNMTELIKILDEGPFAVFKQHWIERGPKKKKSFNCLKDDDGNGVCPLCDDLGDKPKAQAMINVVSMLEDPDKQETLIWRVGATVGDILERAANEKRTSPINRENIYWSVEKVVKPNKTEYRVNPVKKDDDFETDWDITALTDEDFDSFAAEGYDDSEVYFNTVEALDDIVKEMDNNTA